MLTEENPQTHALAQLTGLLTAHQLQLSRDGNAAPEAFSILDVTGRVAGRGLLSSTGQAILTLPAPLPLMLPAPDREPQLMPEAVDVLTGFRREPPVLAHFRTDDGTELQSDVTRFFAAAWPEDLRELVELEFCKSFPAALLEGHEADPASPLGQLFGQVLQSGTMLHMTVDWGDALAWLAEYRPDVLVDREDRPTNKALIFDFEGTCVSCGAQSRETNVFNFCRNCQLEEPLPLRKEVEPNFPPEGISVEDGQL